MASYHLSFYGMKHRKRGFLRVSASEFNAVKLRLPLLDPNNKTSRKTKVSLTLFRIHAMTVRAPLIIIFFKKPLQVCLIFSAADFKNLL